MIFHHNRLTILLFVCFFSHHINNITAEDEEEIIQKLTEKCTKRYCKTGEILSTVVDAHTSYPQIIAGIYVINMCNDSEVFKDKPDAFKYYQNFRTYLRPGQNMDQPERFCYNRYSKYTNQLSICLQQMNIFGSSKKEILIKAFYKLTLAQFPLPTYKYSSEYLEHISRSIKVNTMPSPIVFCRKEAEEIIKMLPDNLDITYSDQNNAV